MTGNLDMFKLANAVSPVVSGGVIGNGGQGAWYTLQDGQRFTLTAEECRQTLIRWLDEEIQQ